MNNDTKLFDLMEKMYLELQETRSEVNEVKDEVKEIRGEVKEVKDEVKEIRGEVKEVKDEVAKTNSIINHEIKPKIVALFDGQTQLNDKVDRIEKQVSKQEEIIIRKVK